jgi:hypothetical protein
MPLSMQSIFREHFEAYAQPLPLPVPLDRPAGAARVR